MLIIAPVGEAEPATYTCSTRSFAMNEAGGCPRCKLKQADGLVDTGERRSVLDQVANLLAGLDM